GRAGGVSTPGGAGGCVSGAAASVEGVRGPKSGAAEGEGDATVAVRTPGWVRDHHEVAAPAANMTTASRKTRIARADPDCEPREDGEVVLMAPPPLGIGPREESGWILAHDDERRAVVARRNRRGAARGGLELDQGDPIGAVFRLVALAAGGVELVFGARSGGDHLDRDLRVAFPHARHVHRAARI